jgi:hypothetical protein
MQRTQLEEDSRLRKEAAAEEAAEQEALENVAIPDGVNVEGGSNSQSTTLRGKARPHPQEEEEGDLIDADMADLFGTDAPAVPMSTDKQTPEMGTSGMDDSMDIV